MSRYAEPIKIRADHWDEDEAAFVKPKLSFTGAQRVILHAGQIKLNSMDSEAEIAESARHMAETLIELLDSWTLRKPDTAYAPGVDRPIWELTLDTLLAQPIDDVLFLFGEAIRRFQGAPAPKGDALINETARAQGLTPANFRPGDPTGGDIPGGPPAG